jgi:hypothetical protein
MVQQTVARLPRGRFWFDGRGWNESSFSRRVHAPRRMAGTFRLAGVKSAHPNLRRFVVGEQKEPKQGWAARRREKKRLKLERTGPSPQAQSERRKGDSPTVKDAANRAGLGGFVGGG